MFWKMIDWLTFRIAQFMVLFVGIWYLWTDGFDAQFIVLWIGVMSVIHIEEMTMKRRDDEDAHNE